MVLIIKRNKKTEGSFIRVKMKTKSMKKTALRIAVVLLLAGLACSACSSGNHMYRHKKSDCDCPTF